MNSALSRSDHTIKVDKSVVDLKNEDVVYLAAEEEEDHIIGQGNAPLNADGTFIRDYVKCRQDADFSCSRPVSSRLDGRFSTADCICVSRFDSILGA